MSYTPPVLAEETAFKTTTLLASGATFTAAIIDVDGYTQVQTEVRASHDGTINVEFCSDSGCTDVVRSLSIPYLATSGYQFFSSPAFGNFIKYQFTNNGTVTQTDFYYTTKILTTALSPQVLTTNAFIVPSMVAQLGRSISVGENPSMELVNEKVKGVAFVTSTPLGSGGTFTTGILDLRGYPQVQTAIVSDQNGTATFEFISEPGGTVVRTLNITYLASTGFQLLSAPAFTDYVRYSYTNGPVAQTTFHYETKFLTSALSGQLLPLNSPVASGMIANLGRNVIVGQQGTGGSFQNVSLTETTNDAGTYYNLNVVSGARPSQLTGRVKVAEVIDTAVSVLQRTITSGKTFFVTDLLLTIDNTDSTSSGRVNLRDGLTITGATVLPIQILEPAAGKSATQVVTHTFSEPIQFSTGLFIEEGAGINLVTGTIIGYEE
jgi:hypothetical protein